MADKVVVYRLALEQCLVKARQSPSAEIKALWHTVADSYRYLIALETRTAEPCSPMEISPAFGPQASALTSN